MEKATVRVYWLHSAVRLATHYAPGTSSDAMPAREAERLEKAGILRIVRPQSDDKAGETLQQNSATEGPAAAILTPTASPISATVADPVDVTPTASEPTATTKATEPDLSAPLTALAIDADLAVLAADALADNELSDTVGDLLFTRQRPGGLIALHGIGKVRAATLSKALDDYIAQNTGGGA